MPECAGMFLEGATRLSGDACLPDALPAEQDGYTRGGRTDEAEGHGGCHAPSAPENQPVALKA